MDVSKMADISTIGANFWMIVSALSAGLVALLTWCFVLARWSATLEEKLRNLEIAHSNTVADHKETKVTVWAKLDVMQGSMNSVLQLLGEMKGRLDYRDDR